MTVAVDNIIFPIEGCRKIEVIFNGTLYRLDNVLYSPKLCHNLLSGLGIDKGEISSVGKVRKIITAYGHD